MTIPEFIQLCGEAPLIAYEVGKRRSVFVPGGEDVCKDVVPAEEELKVMDIEEEVMGCITEEDGNGSRLRRYDILKLMKGLNYQVVINKDTYAKEALEILITLRGLIHNDIDSFKSFTDSGWTRAVGLIKGYLAVNRSLINSDALIPNKYADRAKVAMKLSGYGVNVSVTEDGDLELGDIERAYYELNSRIRKFGGRNFINTLLGSLNYSKSYNRLMLFKQGNRPSIAAPAPLLPYNYLLNLGLRNLNSEGQRLYNTQSNFQSIIDLSRQICFATLETQSYNMWEDVFHVDKSPLDYLRDLVYRESIFNLHQSSPVFILHFLNFIGKSEEELNGAGVADLLKIVSQILKISKMNQFAKLNLKGLSRVRLECLKLDYILKRISISADEINADFLSPTDYDKVNFWNFPVVKMTDGSYWVLPTSIASRCCYEAFVDYIRGKDKGIDSRIGKDYMEKFVASLFAKSHCEYLQGEYTVEIAPGDVEDGECDGMVTSDDHIFLLEIKKKGLARAARQGNDADILLDIAGALLDSQVQTFRTEIALVKTGEPPYAPLELRDNEKSEHISLDGRKIDRLSVALFPFGDMQDRVLMEEVMKTLVKYRFKYNSVIDPTWNKDEKKKAKDRIKSFDKLKDKQDKLSLYLDILQLKKPFFSSWFLDMEMLFHLLKGKKDVEEFKKELLANKFVSFGTYDFYTERSIKESSIDS